MLCVSTDIVRTETEEPHRSACLLTASPNSWSPTQRDCSERFLASMSATTAADSGVIRRPLAYKSLSTVLLLRARQMSMISCAGQHCDHFIALMTTLRALRSAEGRVQTCWPNLRVGNMFNDVRLASLDSSLCTKSSTPLPPR